MTFSTYSLLILAAAGIAACSSNEGTTNPDPNPTQKQEPPAYKKQYDIAKGGVQITAIYFHQDSNEAVAGLKDEWVVIESDRDTSLFDWKLDAMDRQRYTFKRSMKRKLILYTMQGPSGTPTDSTEAWGRKPPAWVWNNTDADTAFLINNMGDTVDRMSYTIQ